MSIIVPSPMCTPNGDCQLTAITEISELHQLRDLYRKNWPKHCVGYYCLDNFIGWLEREPEIENLHIFTLNGDWRSNGLVLIVDRYQLFLHTLNGENNEFLTKAVAQLDWTIGYKVSSFLEQQRPAILNVVRTKNLRLEYDNDTLMFYMNCEDAKKLDNNCPKGFYLKSMCAEKDAEIVDALWPNRHRGSLFLVKRLIAWNVNVGIYTADTNELVAWCLRLQGGFLGALQVKDSHKRMGLGNLVLRASARKIADLGQDVMALVNPNNKPSLNMFNKCGFRIVDKCYWLKTNPTASNFEWPLEI